MQRLTIAVVAYAEFPRGMGPARRVQMIGQGLVENGHEVHLLGCRKQTGVKDTPDTYGLLVHWEKPRHMGKIRGLLNAVLRRLDLVREVHALARRRLHWLVLYNLGIDALPLVVIARWFGARVATDNCDWRYRGDWRHPTTLIRGASFFLAEKLIIPRSDLNLAVSSLIQKRLLELAKDVPVFLLPALVDTKCFARDRDAGQRFRSKWGLGNENVVAYLGGSQKFEGLKELLTASSMLLRQGVQFRLVLATDTVNSEFNEDLPALVQALQVSEHVVLTGILDTDEVIAAMSSANILVVPKRKHIANAAGFPQKLVEYLSMGAAIVATRVGDVPLFLRDGVNARLVDPDSDSELADALRWLLKDEGQREYLGTRARETAVSIFDAKTVTSSLSLCLNRHVDGCLSSNLADEKNPE